MKVIVAILSQSYELVGHISVEPIGEVTIETALNEIDEVYYESGYKMGLKSYIDHHNESSKFSKIELASVPIIRG
jgi:hypothetical protein